MPRPLLDADQYYRGALRGWNASDDLNPADAAAVKAALVALKDLGRKRLGPTGERPYIERDPPYPYSDTLLQAWNELGERFAWTVSHASRVQVRRAAEALLTRFVVPPVSEHDTATIPVGGG